VNDKAVGHCTTHTTTFDTETKDRAVKPVADATMSQALWKSSGVTGLSVTISFEGLCFYDETEFSFKDLLNVWAAGKSVDVKCMERENTDPYMKGKFVLTQLEQDAPAQDDVTYKGTMKNDGCPDIDYTKITVNTTAG
jgi:predicted secreted protein